MSIKLKTPMNMQQAMHGSPMLAQLMRMAEETRACMAVIRPLLPASLRGAVRPGPMQDGTWCLLIAHTAAAAKLRQLAPALLAALRAKGHEVQALRFKIQPPPDSKIQEKTRWP